jgi:transcriptional regulator with XRE-family HTH domain
MESFKSVGQLIAHYREKHNMTQKELGETAGLSGAYISQLERGMVDNPSTQTLDKVCKTIGIRVERFYFAQEVKTRAKKKTTPKAL